jgi:hypothetical protein
MIRFWEIDSIGSIEKQADAKQCAQNHFALILIC